MKDIYLLNYSVKGIKTLDQLISLSFYKKTISKNPDTQDYNVKGIYGMNGSGKSAIITSVDILRNLLINPGYLNNPIVQGNLGEIINKKTEELFIGAEYLVNLKDLFMIFRYEIKLLKDGESVFRELIMIKVRVTAAQRGEINSIADIFRAKIVDVQEESMIIELTGTQSKLEGFMNLLKGYEILELARTGITGLSRGCEDVTYIG